MSTTASDLRIAIIGCGAVAELAHLPAIAQTPGCRVTLLVDTAAGRREALAKKFHVPLADSEWPRHADAFDAAIVALPHSLHETFCVALLRADKPVLLEKPMAITPAECLRIISVEEERRGSVAVGLMRRHQWSHRVARDLIASGVLGPIRHFDFREGHVYDWPVTSDFFFRRETAGGGVLVDTGAHTLDTLLWWLGPAEVISCRDDAVDGVEADCELRLRTAAGAEGVVELSRTRNLRNTAVIEGERGRIEVGMHDNHLSLELCGSELALVGSAVRRAPESAPQGYFDLVLAQMAAWTRAVREKSPVTVDSRAALASVKLIDAAYRMKQPWDLPWTRVPPPPDETR